MFIDCSICGETFEAKTERRKLCDKCQRNSTLAREREDKKIVANKALVGELFSQQYHTCVCKYCGKEFVRFGKVDYFCSTECLQQHIIEHAQCRICQTPLYPLGIIAKNGQGCCSDQCSETYRWKVAKEKGRISKCRNCQKEFIQKTAYAEFCSSDCSAEYKLRTAVQKDKVVVKSSKIRAKCEVCGTEFEKNVHATQYTCSKECSAIRTQRVQQAAQDKAKAARKREREAARKPNVDRRLLIDNILKGLITGAEARKAHLCTCCKTSQAQCEMFQSKFTYHPKGTVIKAIDGHNVVLVCPQYND